MLSVEALEAGYGTMSILRGVTLSVDADESVAIIGANGAGKSTLVRTICGLTPARAGSIRMAGASLESIPPHVRVGHGISTVLEGRNLFGELSVRANLALALARGRQRGAGKQRFGMDDVFQLFGFMRNRAETPVDVLSGGEQQMVAIARALLLQPDLLIMDEPSTGLAPKVVTDIIDVIGHLRRGGMSILLVEQNVALAARASDRGYVMALGRVVHEIRRGEWEAFLHDEALLRAYLGG
ncbi:MAG: ABC transporter ATP-binding protein [Burkholderiales bacterium]